MESRTGVVTVAQSRVPYLVKAFLVLLFTTADLILSSTSDFHDFPQHGIWYPMAILGVHFLAQLLNAMILFMLVAGTYLFQVGLVGVLMSEFRAVVIIAPVYAVVYGSYFATKAYYLIAKRLDEEELWDVDAFFALSVLQKIVASLYYLVVLHSTFKLGELRWYQRRPWVNKFREHTRSGGEGVELANFRG